LPVVCDLVRQGHHQVKVRPVAVKPALPAATARSCRQSRSGPAIPRASRPR
jgi:hypothetical protein